MRTKTVIRKTAETDIKLTINLDGSGSSDVDTGCGFLNHMLTLLAFHGGFDLTVGCKGDTEVDYHHTVEDVGIVLGQAIRGALGEKFAINRYGSIILPMDEALVLVALDISGRPFLSFNADIPAEKVGNFDTELVEEFMFALARSLSCTLHILKLAGKNSHHIIEAMFKALGRALRDALRETSGGLPSTKGVLL
ncbi:MAG TPA: imidazoleglycerol-phosphate dehydratase HisB [Clostridiales bacterium]|nr:imidazoleglycerol-phosphate dehydratase HisB [Clostridiales bacterium]